jgi:hypothetical protein
MFSMKLVNRFAHGKTTPPVSTEKHTPDSCRKAICKRKK